ncbi:MAG: HlyD family type I secretion periplasmic adaptor subunit [Hyphomonadaceae bacterium]|jgi:HlyD family secretion protein|nr:HlyD family type I secretion periplasmic adaptor subunit [Hyphomonadaceae bacterium]
MTTPCLGIDEWHRGVSAGVRWPILIGVAILLACVGGFGAWTAIAPLEGAVVVSGSFVATGQNKHIQHLEGGILREVLVKEGDLVEVDQTLLRLDATAASSKLRRLVLRNHRSIIMKARLEAELDGRSAFTMPADLAGEAVDPEILGIFERQTVELRARRTKIATEEEVLRKEIAGLQESTGGYAAQAQSTRQRMGLFAEELHDKQRLLAQQLARRSEVLALQRSEAALTGELGELLARMADAKERMARAEQQIAQLHSAATQKTIEELRATETELDDLQEQIRAARDVVDRTEVRSPVRGIVVKLNQHTAGGVIGAGSAILELLPVNDELIIEARLNPSEIWHVKKGQDALVRLTALNQRVTPMVEGKVIYLSADAVASQSGARAKIEQEAPYRPFYVVRVRLSEVDVHSKVHAFRPTPGMPADVFIRTGERTFFDYIMRPVWDSFSRAFRES